MSLATFQNILRVEGRSEETIRTYTKCIRGYIAWLKGKPPTPDNVLQFMGGLVKRELKPSTMRLYKIALKLYFDKENLKFPKVKTPVVRWGKPKALSEKDMRTLYHATGGNPRARAMLSIAYSTAVRIEELTTRKMSDFNLHPDEDDERVQGPSLFVSGKTGPESDAWLPLDDVAVKDLEGYLKTLPRKLKNDEYIFSGKYPDIPMSTNRAREILYGILRRAGMEKHGWHIIRHTRLTHMSMAEVPQGVIQSMARHKDPEMTLRYTQGTTENIRTKCKGMMKKVLE